MQMGKKIMIAKRDRLRMELENLKDQLKEIQDLYILDKEKLTN